MRQIVKRMQTTLSILLAAAMVITMVPETAVSAFAAETGEAEIQEAAGDEDSEGTPDEPQEAAGDEDSEGTPGEQQEAAVDENSEATPDEQQEAAGDEDSEGTPDEQQEAAGDEDTEGTPDEQQEAAGDENSEGILDEQQEAAGDEDTQDSLNEVTDAETAGESQDGDTASQESWYTVTYVYSNEEGTITDPIEKDAEPNAEYSFKHKPDQGYTTVSVKAGLTENYDAQSQTFSKEISMDVSAEDAKGYKQYTIKGTDVTGDITIVMISQKTEADSYVDKTVTFHNSGEHTSYAVTKDSAVTLKAGTNHTYELSKAAVKVEFTVTAEGSYTPGVSLDEKTLEPVKEPVTKKTNKGTTTEYSYEIPAESIGDSVVEITEQAVTRNLYFSFNKDEITVAVNYQGERIAYINYQAYPVKVTEGESYTIVVQPKENCEIAGITAETDGKTTAIAVKDKEKTAGGEYTITIAEGSDTKITITSTAQIAYSLADKTNSSTELTASKDKKGTVTYAVSGGRTYVTKVVRGTKKVVLSRVRIDGAASRATKAAVTENGASAEISVAAAEAGGVLTVTLCEQQNGAETAVASYQLSVAPTVKQIIIKDGNKAMTEAELPADSVKSYTLEMSPKTASFNDIGVEITADSEEDADIASAQAAVSAEIADGKLNVKVNPATEAAVASAKPVIVRIVNTNLDKTAEGYTVGQLRITVKAPALATTAPTVKYKDADNRYLTMTVGVPQTVVQPQKGNIWYRIEATRIIDGVSGVPVYTVYQKKADTSQDVKLDLGDIYDKLGADLQKKIKADEKFKTVQYGAGESYDISVTLLQTLDDKELTQDTESKRAAFTGGTTELKNVKTKTPAYETKLSLKKGTTTIYTGQQNVKIATVQFGKNTTYKNVQDDNIKVTDNKDNMITCTYNAQDGGIYASVKAGTATGKYTVTVRAEAPYGAQSAAASVAVTVVKGIEDIKVTPASYTIFKSSGKAATLKVTTVLNGGTKANQPKTKKVTYSIVKAAKKSSSGEWKETPLSGTALDGFVKINKTNGTVTVDKKYILSGGAGEDTFRVKVTAADYAGNTAVNYTDEITITGRALQIGRVVIMKKSGAQYCVITGGNEEVTPAKIQGAMVTALAATAPEKNTYTADEYQQYVIPAKNLTFTSGNKKVISIDEKGTLQVAYKAAKNIKITAAANDGGKSKASLQKLTIVCADTPAEYGLKVEDATLQKEYSVSDSYEEETVSFAGTTDTALRLTVMKKRSAESLWQDISDNLYNVSVTLKGVKILEKNPEIGQYLVVANQKEARVTLKYKMDGKTISKTYKIINEAYTTAQTPKLKAGGSLTAGKYPSEQSITYTLSGAYQYKNKIARVELDKGGLYGSKTMAQYESFEKAIGGKEILTLPVEDNGSFALTFAATEKGVTAGSYKLWVTFGSLDGDNRFIPDTKSKLVIIKAVKPAKMVYKPVSKVGLSAADTTGTALKGTGKNYTYEKYETLYNVIGSDGKVNHFTDYFELASDGSGNGKVLRLKTNLDEEAISYITSKDGVKDCTGCVSYTVENINESKSSTTKITVTFTNVSAKK